MNALESRIARLESIEAIRQLKHRYFMACDRKEPEAVRQCFVDGPIDIEYGRVDNFGCADDMVAVYTRYACESHIVEMHHAQNPVITLLSETEAQGVWGLYYYLINTQRDEVTQLGGFYEDRYRRERGEWKISASRCEVTSTQIMDLGEGLARVIFAGCQAPTEIDDPSHQVIEE